MLFSRLFQCLYSFLFLFVLMFSETSMAMELNKSIKTNQEFTGLIVDFDLTSSLDDLVEIEFRFQEKNGSFSEWVKLEIASGENKQSGIINTNPAVGFEYKTTVNAGPDHIKPKISNLKFSSINVPPTEYDRVVVSQSSIAGSLNNFFRIITRSQWGANDEYNYKTNGNNDFEQGDRSKIENNDPEIARVVRNENGNELKWPMEYVANMRMVVIHHTASTSNLNDPRQAIRNIHYYHAVRRGWGDIGYNFIIDQQGNIYEGRKGGEGVVGGHALPVNKTSVGISVLGNFETQRVPKPVLDALTKIVSHQVQTYGLDATGSVSYKGNRYPVVSGHRDNSKTVCPGRNLYSLLPLIRSLVKNGQVLEYEQNFLNQQNYAYIDLDPLRDVVEIKPNEVHNITVKVKNAGKESWQKSNTTFKVLNASEAKSLLSLNNEISMTESMVRPGQTAQFVIPIRALAGSSGFTSIIGQIVMHNENRYAVPIFVPINVVNPTPISISPKKIDGYRFAVVGGNPINLELAKGERRNITLRIRNSGSRSWNVDYQYLKLGMHTPRDGNSLLFKTGPRVATFGTQEIKPNQTYNINLTVQAPNRDITITEKLAPVIDGLMWFEDDLPITINAKVGKGSVVQKNNIQQSVSLQKSNSPQFVEYKFYNNSNETLLANTVSVNVIGGNLLEAAGAKMIENRVEPNEEGTIRVQIVPKTPQSRILNIRILNSNQLVFPEMFKLQVNITDSGLNSANAQDSSSQNENIYLNSDQAKTQSDQLGPEIKINLSSFELSEAVLEFTETGQFVIDESQKIPINKDHNKTAVIFTDGEKIYLTFNNQTYTASNKVVFEPTGSSNINKIANYENRPAWNRNLNDNQFRGGFEFTLFNKKLVAINVLPLEQYMWGLAEISNNAEIEKIKTIIVSARSYAYFHLKDGKNRKFPNRGFDLDDNPDNTQKYLGYGFEVRSPNVVKAVKETAGKIITYNDNLVIIPYFNQSDGRTRTANEVWGWTTTPYLQSVQDKYCANPTALLGHGVGISGCGSTGMAQAGFNHEQIIQYFLTGVQFKNVYSNLSIATETNINFSDIKATTKFREAVLFIAKNGIVEGYSDGTFKPLNTINRAEFVKIIIEAKYANDKNSIDKFHSQNCFKDVPTDEWYTKYVCKAKSENIVSGYPDGTFKPASYINIVEALKIVIETFNNSIPEVKGEWYAKYVQFARNNNLLLDDFSNFAKFLLRGEMAELIYRIIK